MTGASAEWAITASKLRFGPEARIDERDGAYHVFLRDKLLGTGLTWEAAFKDAHEKNQDIPQPSPDVFYRNPMPVGEEFVEEFVGAMRQRDLFTEFLLWYGEKGVQDPEVYPRALRRGEWLEQLGTFIAGLDE